LPTAFDDDREAAADGWINPLLDHRPDITRLTAPVRDHLAAITRLLDTAETHPWTG